jgi:hypothetical protein
MNIGPLLGIAPNVLNKIHHGAQVTGLAACGQEAYIGFWNSIGLTE